MEGYLHIRQSNEKGNFGDNSWKLRFFRCAFVWAIWLVACIKTNYLCFTHTKTINRQTIFPCMTLTACTRYLILIQAWHPVLWILVVAKISALKRSTINESIFSPTTFLNANLNSIDRTVIFLDLVRNINNNNKNNIIALKPADQLETTKTLWVRSRLSVLIQLGVSFT